MQGLEPLGTKIDYLSGLDFPFLTVDLHRKRHLNKIFFFLSVFQKTHLMWVSGGGGEGQGRGAGQGVGFEHNQFLLT